MQRIRIIAAAGLAAATVGLVASQGSTAVIAGDPNQIAADPTPAPLVPLAGAEALATVAQFRMSSPGSSTSINPSVTNLSAASTIGAQSLEVLILDCFGALGGVGLTIDSVSATAPPGGTVTVTTGNDADDVGPAVVTYTGFNDNESASMSLDPDTFTDSGFGAVRRDLRGCNVEAVFSGGLRGSAKVTFNSTSGVTLANLKQRNP